MRGTDAHISVVQEISAILRRVTTPIADNAKEFHDFVEALLLSHGLDVKREVWTNNGDGIVGRYDLVVYDECNCALELDRRLVKAKSQQKLLGFNGGRIAVLRGNLPPHDLAGIDAIISLPVVRLPR